MSRFKMLSLTLILVGSLFFAAVPPVHPAAPGQIVLISALPEGGPPLPSDLRILERYDAFVLAEVQPGQMAALQAQYRVDPLPGRTVVALDGVTFDTVQGEPAIAADRRAAPGDPYYLVQFYGPPKAEWLANLKALGVTFLGYHPSFTYIVKMDPALLPEVQAAHAVQWVGPYHPAYRLAAEAELAQALARDGQMALTIRAFPGENAAALQQRLEATGVRVEFFSPRNPPLARVWAAPEQLSRLAALPGVYRVEPYIPPALVNERGAQVLHTWDLRRASRNSLLQDLMGQGQVAGMVDSGLDDNNTAPRINDFYDFTGGAQTSRVVAAVAGNGCTGACSCYGQDDDVASGHGTHVAGSIVANGYNALLQRGLQDQARSADPGFDYAWGVGQAPEAEIAFAFTAGTYYGYQGTLCGLGDVYTTWQSLYDQGARNANNSWGSSANTYGGESIAADQVMWDRQDYLLVVAAGNNGPGWTTIQQPATAKNVVTVGATNNRRSAGGGTSSSSQASSAGLLTDFSSRGPIGSAVSTKPDVVAPGADLLSTRSTFIANSVVTLWGNEAGDGDGDGHLDYWWSGGTSMAAPLVTGAATLIRDYFQDIQGLGDTTPPSAALIKAALLNGAVDTGYGYESFAAAPYGGRNLQGWGMVNIEQSITPRAPRSFFYDDLTDITGANHQSGIGFTTSGQSKEYTFDIVDRGEPLKVTLTWTDRQNGSDGFAVNNLDLLVTNPNNVQYQGNVFSGAWTVGGGSADTQNNVEAVYRLNPIAGTWKIRVTDASHGGGVQPYALFVSGALGTSPAFTRSDAGGRAGTSAQPYFPSLSPLAGTDEHTVPGGSFVTTFRLTNWGTNPDTISLSAAATGMSGNGVAGIAATFNPAGPLALAAGQSQDVTATVTVDGAMPVGPYDLTITAASAGTGSRRDAMVIGLNITPPIGPSNETPAVDEPGPQFAPDFWGNGQTLWTAYLTAESHNNGEAEILTARSLDGGQTWTNMGQVDANDGTYLLGPAIAGSSDGGSITVVWIPASAAGVYARTWTTAGGWGAIRTLASYMSGYVVSDPDVIYDNDGDILAVWFAFKDASTPGGVYSSYSTNNGAVWTSATLVPDASGVGVPHRWPALTLDTQRNAVWMAYNPRILDLDRDIRLKHWDGGSNRWDRAGMRNIAVATTSERESHPTIAYVAATDTLWVAWHRYPSYAVSTPHLYYAVSSGTLPAPTFGAPYGPYGARTVEQATPGIASNAAYAYISYLAYQDAYRGANVYLLKAPAGGGAPLEDRQLTVTVDDPPLYAGGNAGTPRLILAQTTLNGLTWTGPTLLYSKNPPNNGDPDYGGNLGVSQALFNLEENLDLYLLQAGAWLPAGLPYQVYLPLISR